eukprot:scaffold106801_cov54-Phaeocystis_antarctica.AAC.1
MTPAFRDGVGAAGGVAEFGRRSRSVCFRTRPSRNGLIQVDAATTRALASALPTLTHSCLRRGTALTLKGARLGSGNLRLRDQQGPRTRRGERAASGESSRAASQRPA